MLSGKGKLVFIALLAAMIFVTGQARLKLDDIVAPFRDDFREMLYLPRGDGLKIIACGFDTPLADALFIKGMIYYAESVRADNKSGRREYTYELFDVITDLSPRFTRAYQVGALFLTGSSSFEANLDGVKLLEKGVEISTRMEKEGDPISPDPRWLFHTIIANAYEVNVQARRRQENDVQGIYEARRRASEEFRAAAASPGAPPYIIDVAAGYESGLGGAARIESALYSVQSVWKMLYQRAEETGDKDMQTDLQSRIDELQSQIDKIELTRREEADLGVLGKIYLQRHGAAPVGVADMIRDGLLPRTPDAPLGTGDAPDYWLALPDGAFKSKKLAEMESDNQLDQLRHAMFSYIRGASAYPESPEELVRQKLLDVIPEPPLKLLGQIYTYDPETGEFEEKMPEGPELPPERR